MSRVCSRYQHSVLPKHECVVFTNVIRRSRFSQDLSKFVLVSVVCVCVCVFLVSCMRRMLRGECPETNYVLPLIHVLLSSEMRGDLICNNQIDLISMSRVTVKDELHELTLMRWNDTVHNFRAVHVNIHEKSRQVVTGSNDVEESFRLFTSFSSLKKSISDIPSWETLKYFLLPFTRRDIGS